MSVPTISHPTDRPNFSVVDVGGVTYWFSYDTCVAFNRWNGDGAIVRENEWSMTTGKHLNMIDYGNKETRVDGETFKRLLIDGKQK